MGASIFKWAPATITSLIRVRGHGDSFEARLEVLANSSP